MNAEIHCNQSLLLQGDFDGELDAAQAATLALHKENCALCAQADIRLERTKAMMRSAPRFNAPNSLRDALAERLRTANADTVASNAVAPAKKSANALRYLLSGAGLGAVAAGVLAFVLLGLPSQSTTDLLVDNHLRAMQSPAHLLDVVSSEHHTVKPWFAGHLQFAPPVKDMEGFGYPLRGGRVDVIEGRSVAVLVYQAGQHTVDVFVAPKISKRFATTETTVRGFNIRQWEAEDLDVWAISDLNSHELDAFVEHWKAAR